MRAALVSTLAWVPRALHIDAPGVRYVEKCSEISDQNPDMCDQKFGKPVVRNFSRPQGHKRAVHDAMWRCREIGHM